MIRTFKSRKTDPKQTERDNRFVRMRVTFFVVLYFFSSLPYSWRVCIYVYAIHVFPTVPIRFMNFIEDPHMNEEIIGEYRMRH